MAVKNTQKLDTRVTARPDNGNFQHGMTSFNNTQKGKTRTDFPLDKADDKS
jgi:hypothetical protein